MLKRVSIFLALIIFGSFSGPLHAQYRRRHTDITREMIRLLREPKPQDYYFALLPPDISGLVCKMSGLNVKSKLEDAFKQENKENAVFLASISLKVFKDSVYHWAFERGNLFATRLFISMDPHMRSDELYEGLSMAAYCGFNPVIKRCLDAGANPNKSGMDKCSLLSMVICQGNDSCARDLLAAGANPNKRGGKFSPSPLVVAAEHNNIEMVKLLFRMQANPNGRGKHDYNALYYAAENNNLEMMKLLLAHGCSARYMPKVRWHSSPLQEAAIHGNLEMVRLLLDAGAFPKVETYERRYEGSLTGTSWTVYKRKCPELIKSEIEKLLEQARDRIKKEVVRLRAK